MDSDIKQKFEELMLAVAKAKPNDRSAKDRSYAILRTMLEQAMAYFIVFILERY